MNASDLDTDADSDIDDQQHLSIANGPSPTASPSPCPTTSSVWSRATRKYRCVPWMGISHNTAAISRMQFDVVTAKCLITRAYLNPQLKSGQNQKKCKKQAKRYLSHPYFAAQRATPKAKKNKRSWICSLDNKQAMKEIDRLERALATEKQRRKDCERRHEEEMAKMTRTQTRATHKRKMSHARHAEEEEKCHKQMTELREKYKTLKKQTACEYPSYWRVSSSTNYDEPKVVLMRLRGEAVQPLIREFKQSMVMSDYPAANVVKIGTAQKQTRPWTPSRIRASAKSSARRRGGEMEPISRRRRDTLWTTATPPNVHTHMSRLTAVALFTKCFTAKSFVERAQWATQTLTSRIGHRSRADRSTILCWDPARKGIST